MSDNLRVISFEDKGAYPAITMRITGNGPTIALGLKDNEIPGKPPSYHFDKTTLSRSKIAAALEGTTATIQGGILSDHIAAKLDSVIYDLMKEKHRFSEEDRAVVKAVQEHLVQEHIKKSANTPLSSPFDSTPAQKKLEAIERASRAIGNSPSPDYPNVDREEQLQKQIGAFYDGLSPEQKDIFVNPNPPESPFPSEDSYGEGIMWGIAPDRVNEEYKRHLTETIQWQTDVETFEKSLTPEQKAEWDKIRETTERKNPRLTLIDEDRPETLPAHKASPEKPGFSHEIQAPGRYTFKDDVQRGQELINRLGSAEGLKTIDLGKSGPKANGEDGYFGPATRKAVLAAEEHLGIVPPTGKITPELLEKLETRLAALEREAKTASQARTTLEDFGQPSDIVLLQEDQPGSGQRLVGKVFGMVPERETPVDPAALTAQNTPLALKL